MSGIDMWLPNDPPKEDVFFGIDRSVAPARFMTPPPRRSPWRRFRDRLGAWLYELSSWVLGGDAHG